MLAKMCFVEAFVTLLSGGFFAALMLWHADTDTDDGGYAPVGGSLRIGWTSPLDEEMPTGERRVGGRLSPVHSERGL